LAAAIPVRIRLSAEMGVGFEGYGACQVAYRTVLADQLAGGS
jgi:hypothetical protein